MRRPVRLGAQGRELWDAVTGVYELSPAEGAELSRACRCLDRLAQMDKVLAADGVTAAGSMGQLRAHPLLAAMDSAERTLDVLLRGLSLPMPDESAGRRRSPQAVAAAQARWRGHQAG